MRTLGLNRPVTITLDSGGNGTALLGPATPGETWYPTSVQVQSAGSVFVATLPTCFIYTGPSAAAGTFVDSTYDVQGASSSIISGQIIYPGQYVIAVWAGAAAHAAATLIVTGTRTVPLWVCHSLIP
jgi:hypothetical protein